MKHKKYPQNIEYNLRIFQEGDKKKNNGRDANERYASFDYCFNYFQSFKDSGRIKDMANKANLQTSCLHLGFYLASWGMLRGSSFLLEKSSRYLVPLIKLISEYNPIIWLVDWPVPHNFHTNLV